MNKYLVYGIKKLANVIELLEDSSQKEEMSKWMAEINDNLQAYFGKNEDMDEVVKEIDRIKSLTDPELLSEWYFYYSLVEVYGCFGSRDVQQRQLLEDELAERGMEREMEKLTERCQPPLSSEEMEDNDFPNRELQAVDCKQAKKVLDLG